MIETMRAWIEPLDLSNDALAYEAISEVPPGGHYFGAPHTLSRFENAFHRPLISDVRNFQNWAEAGAHNATKRANLIWKRMLEQYTQPPLDKARLEAIDVYIAKRTNEITQKGLGAM
jgi:trimethylamine--corrinoid protein Co-methyltransferase